jgi:hypothetical protein
MSQRFSGSAGPGDDWPDDLWPDDDDQPGGQGGQTEGRAGHAESGAGHSEGGAPGGPRSAPPMAPGRPEDRPPKRRSRPALLLVIALLAAAARAGIVLAVDGLSGSSGVTAGSASQPSSLTPVAPGGNGQPGGALPGTGSGRTGTLFVIGKVTAVSSRSITIGGAAHTVTAAVTGSTRVTGSASSIGAIKVGDQVSAQIVQNGGRATATAIQYPAHSPLGGSAP